MMYPWIWNHLPGPMWVRVATAAIVILAVVLVLFEFVYPWLAPLLPFQQQTVE